MSLRILSGKGEFQIMPFQKLGGKCHFLLRFCTRNWSETYTFLLITSFNIKPIFNQLKSNTMCLSCHCGACIRVSKWLVANVILSLQTPLGVVWPNTIYFWVRLHSTSPKGWWSLVHWYSDLCLCLAHQCILNWTTGWAETSAHPGSLTKVLAWGHPESSVGKGDGDQIRCTNKVTSEYLLSTWTRCLASAYR